MNPVRIAARSLIVAVVGLVLVASPAAADPPAPGDYTSTVSRIEPDVAGVEVDVIGGDSFLEISAELGVEVVVLGYEDEPYVRVTPDGTVERNRNSPATYLNDDRYGRIDVPADLVGVDVTELDADWEQVADSGTYAWHDHRIHWMAPDAPPAVSRGETFGWNGTVPMLVDGTRVEVHGEILYEHDVSPVPWVLGAVVVAAVLYLVLRSRLRVLAAVGAVVGTAGIYVAWATYSLSPRGVGETPLPVIVVAVAAALAVVTVLVAERLRPFVALGTAAALAGWGILRFGVLTNPVLPTTAPAFVDRAVTAAALAVAVVVAAVGVLSVGPPPVPEEAATPE